MTAESRAKFCGNVKEATDIPLHVAQEAIPMIKANAAFKDVDTVELITRAKERCKNRIPVTKRLAYYLTALVKHAQHF